MTTCILVDGWAGYQRIPVEILGETPKRYRVKLIERSKLPGRNNWRNAGDVVLVPKHAVRIMTESQ